MSSMPTDGTTMTAFLASIAESRILTGKGLRKVKSNE